MTTNPPNTHTGASLKTQPITHTDVEWRRETDRRNEGRSVSPSSRVEDCTIGKGSYIGPFCNLYGCSIGKDCTIGAFVEIQRGVVIGDRCKISSQSFLCSGVTIEKDVFVGHGVMMMNDRHPVASREGQRTRQLEEEIEKTMIEQDVSIGTGAILFPVRIGRGAQIGAGAVVTKDVPPGGVWIGNPAHPLKKVTKSEGEESKDAHSLCEFITAVYMPEAGD